MKEMFAAGSPPTEWSILEDPTGPRAGGPLEPGGERPVEPTGELVDVVMAGPGWWLERIVSRGDVTPEGEWYDQDSDEWVVVVRGAAVLSVEVGGARRSWSLDPGDSCFLPAHCRHRVEWTTPDEPTVWLAVHRRARVK